MKKTMTLFLGVCMSLSMFAQEKEKFSHVSLGLRGGISVMRDYGKYNVIEDRMNYLGGANLEYTFNPLWGFGLDYVYMPYDQDYQDAGKLTGLAHEATAYVSVNLSNLLAQYRSGHWQKLNFYGNLGGGISFFDYDNTMSGQKGDDKCLVIPAGLTMEYNLGKVFAINLGAEYRWHKYTDMKKDMVGRTGYDNYGFMLATAGFKFKFAGSKKHVRNISYETFELARAYDACAPKINALQEEVNKEKAALNAKIVEQDAALDAQNQQINKLNGTVKDLEDKMNTYMANVASREQRNAAEIAAIKKAQETVVKEAFNALEFETGSSVIKSTSYRSLDKLAEVIQANPSWRLKLNGYTDNSGNLEKNIQLSQERADAVRSYLIEKGVSAAKVTAEGHGPENPVASNSTAQGRAKNRRVEIKID